MLPMCKLLSIRSMVFGIILEYNSEPFLTRVYARPNWEIFRIPGSEPARLTSDERLRGLFRIADLGFRDFHRVVIVLHVPGGHSLHQSLLGSR